MIALSLKEPYHAEWLCTYCRQDSQATLIFPTNMMVMRCSNCNTEIKMRWMLAFFTERAGIKYRGLS